MPLFRTSGKRGGAKAPPGRKRLRDMEWTGGCWKTDEDGPVLSLRKLSLLSLADNMKEVWAKDYANNYLDQYSFRYIMGPFNLLTGELVEELVWLLCNRKQLSRAALHLLLVPQLRGLSLESCPALVTPVICTHIAARCQDLWSLNLSGAQQLPSKVLSETLHSLPALRSLSLAGMPCDRRVIRTIAQRCRLLRHLDVSRCHLLSPGALLPLGGGAFCSSSGSPESLLALDIGFGVQEGDPVAAAAYLLLSLPSLERVALEGIEKACRLIEQREFSLADEFTNREGVAPLKEVWQEIRDKQDRDNLRMRREKTTVHREYEDEEEEGIFLEEYKSESEEDASRDEVSSCSHSQSVGRKRHLSQSDFALKLRDVKGLTCDSLDSLGRLCPGICCMAVNVDPSEDTRGRSKVSRLAVDLEAWSGQLQRLSVQFPGNLADLLPTLLVAGSSLVSLTLEGVKTNSYTRLSPVIRACPRLRDLLISAEPPPSFLQMEHEEDQQDNGDLPCLPNLCSLTLSFSYEHSQIKPAMFWTSLMRVLRCLLTSSPLLEKLSLVSLPCPLDYTLQNVLLAENFDLGASAESTGSPLLPLERLQHIDLQRTDVKMTTVKSLLQRSKRLKYVDVSSCWQISYSEWLACKTSSNVQVVWA
uniref:Si:ch211-214j8.12 n=1 Tax=Amphilophus citrinellus TaxID=61819 RepID=A0A3Q0R3I0_AMPCI